MDTKSSHKLDCTVQNYAWGMKGKEAYISNLLGLPPNEDPKAELWMGAHPRAPSLLNSTSLFDLIQDQPVGILGEKSHQKWGKMLPYLFKVLSANEALSIQLHPNKKEAEELHRADPEHYPDDNHKPEIAIALDQLEALIGFESYTKLVEDLKHYPEIKTFIGSEKMDALEQAMSKDDSDKLKALKDAFVSMNLKALQEREPLQKLNQTLYERLKTNSELTPKESWYLELYPKYPNGDVGLFALFFLNYRTLNQGEAVFLKADVPHAYLKGNIIECMANSDNVVRAGLTPKFVDVENLAKITQYELEPLKIQTGEDNGLEGRVYKTPVEELEVHVFESSAHELIVDLRAWQGASIGVVLKGSLELGVGQSYQKGDVFLIPDEATLKAILSPNTQTAIAKPAI